MNDTAPTAAPDLTTHTCACCGATWTTDPQNRRRGRPRVWCGDRCRELEKALARVAKLMEAAPLEATHASKLRSRLWGMANGLNFQGTPKASPTSERQSSAARSRK